MLLRGVLERLRSYPEGGGEEAAKLQAVLPILREIGWDDTDFNQVAFEHSVAARGGGRVDIALRAPRRGNVALVEVKAPGRKLDDFVAQVLEYAFHDGVDICVLTTGLVWWLYLPREKGQPTERRFAVLDLQTDAIDELVDGFETYLSRDSLLDRSAEQRAKQALEALLNQGRLATEIPRVWDQMLSEPDHELIELIERRVFSKVRLRPSAELIADVLRSSAVKGMAAGGDRPTRPIADPPRPTTPKRGSEKKPSPRAKTPGGKPEAYRVFEADHSFVSWNRMLLDVAEAVYDRHGFDFDRALELRGSKRRYYSRSAEVLEQMTSPRPIGQSGYYVETHFSANDCVKRATELLQHFGHNADDLKIPSD